MYRIKSLLGNNMLTVGALSYRKSIDYEDSQPCLTGLLLSTLEDVSSSRGQQNRKVAEISVLYQDLHLSISYIESPSFQWLKHVFNYSSGCLSNLQEFDGISSVFIFKTFKAQLISMHKEIAHSLKYCPQNPHKKLSAMAFLVNRRQKQVNPQGSLASNPT